MTSALFTPVTLGPKTYPNRIAIAPMAQYSADADGNFTDWHQMHLGGLASSGAGVVVIEATAVTPEGRCTLADPGLYSDANEASLKRIIDTIRQWSGAMIGIQLGHGGRKGSTAVHWEGGRPIASDAGGWETLAPSAAGYADWPAPRAATASDIAGLIEAFAAAAARAVRAGVDLIEIHAAHGYLLHQFLSPLSNLRDDEWGGSPENRMRLPLAVFEAVRDAAPGVTLGVRLTGSDWIEGGITPADAVAFARALEHRGCHYVDVTSGALDPAQKIAVGPGYQVPFAAEVKRATGLAVRAVGMIVSPAQAEEIIGSGSADIVAVARALIANPHWPWNAARQLGAQAEIPPQYQRAAPGVWPGWEMG